MKKLRRKSSRKEHSSERVLAHVRVEVLKAKDIFRTISKLRTEVAPHFYPEIANQVLTLRKHSDRISNVSFSMSLFELKSISALSLVSISNELKWAGSYLPLFSKPLSKYIALSGEYEDRLLESKFDECKSILDQIENEMGFSLWLIKNRIVLLQHSQGLEAQKRYAREVKEQVPERGTVLFITHFISQKAEPSVSAGLFQREFFGILNDITLPSWFRDYLIYHITPVRTTLLNNISSILRYESTGTIIDYYEALLDMSKIIIATLSKDLYPVLMRTLAAVQGDLNDDRINKYMPDRS